MSEQCAVCAGKTNLFSYGVFSCNACTLFFRRVISAKNPVELCKNRHSCQIFSLNCRFCRFQQCIQSGMSQFPRKPLSPEAHLSLTISINNLLIMDNHRRQKLLDYCITDDVDYTVEQIARSTVILPKKPPNLKMNLCDWGFMCGFTTMDFMKKFEFVDFFENFSDLKNFLKFSHFPCGVFYNAMNSYLRDSQKMTFPDGSESFPIVAGPIFNEDFLNRIRYRLVIRIRELKVTKEEFVLISAILICNPAIPLITDSTRSLLSSYQKSYTSTLVHYCLITYQQSGPSRISDLLSLIHVVHLTLGDLRSHFQILQFHFPNLPLRSIIRDCLTNCTDN